MWNFIQEALRYPFMQQALWVALLLALTCALLSCFLVLKGWSLMADAISHALLVGVVIAHALGLPLLLGAFGAGLSCASLTAWLERRSSLKSDSLLGISFATLFALGIAFSSGGQHLVHLLFGNLLGMLPAQRLQILLICLLILLVLALKGRELMLFVFDPVQARLVGLAPARLGALLLVLLTLITVAALQAVGVILVVALLIAPALAAQLLTKRFGLMLLLASLIAVLSTAAGVLLSYRWNSAPGATIVLCQTVAFLLALLLRHIRQHNRTLYWG